jgi:hypothetical protein
VITPWTSWVANKPVLNLEMTLSIRTIGLFLIALTSLMLGIGCQSSSTVVCESGRVCPSGFVCDSVLVILQSTTPRLATLSLERALS